MSIDLQYTLQQEHLLADGLTIERIKRRFKNRMIWAACVLLAAVGLQMPDDASRGLYLSLALTTIAVNLSLAYGLQPLMLRKQIARLDLTDHPFDLQLDDAGISIQRQKDRQQIAWTQVLGWYQGQQSYLLELPMREVILVPYTVLSEQRSAFDALVSAKRGQAKR